MNVVQQLIQLLSLWAYFCQEIHFTHSSPEVERIATPQTIYIKFFLGGSVCSFPKAFPLGTSFLDNLLCLGMILLWCFCQNSALPLSTIITSFGISWAPPLRADALVQVFSCHSHQNVSMPLPDCIPIPGSSRSDCQLQGTIMFGLQLCFNFHSKYLTEVVSCLSQYLNQVHICWAKSTHLPVSVDMAVTMAGVSSSLPHSFTQYC